jgi:MFS family permease
MMVIDRRRIYFNGVMGALGGLVGWAIISVALRFSTDSTFLLYLKDALLGAAVGIAVGAALGSVEGLIFNRSVRKTIQGAGYGGCLGLAAGLVGLVIGELIFSLAGGGVWPRAVGWAIFGLLMGSSEGIANKMPSKASYGALGGLLGGLVGGSTYERLNLVLRSSTGDRELALAVGGAVGLIILGAAIGSIIGLVETIMRTAWLRFTRGRLEGQTRMLDRRKQHLTLGRDDGCDLFIPGDKGVMPRHALIKVENNQFVIVPYPEGGGTVQLVTEQGEQTVGQHTLRSGDTIQLGRSRMVFQTE